MGRCFRWSAAPVLVVLTAGCTTHGFDANLKASAIQIGATEAELLAAAGPPTHRQEPPLAECAKAGGTHQLFYEVTIRHVVDWFEATPSSALLFCVGAESRIIDKEDFIY